MSDKTEVANLIGIVRFLGMEEKRGIDNVLSPENRRHLRETANTIERMKGLLSVAACPNCDGSGVIGVETTVTECCGQPLPSGECCGNPVPGVELEQQQCQWCYEKAVLLGEDDE